jgi:hypothetical protein
MLTAWGGGRDRVKPRRHAAGLRAPAAGPSNHHRRQCLVWRSEPQAPSARTPSDRHHTGHTPARCCGRSAASSPANAADPPLALTAAVSAATILRFVTRPATRR